MNYAAGDVYGTDLCRQLRDEHSWQGLLFIQSANDGAADVSTYMDAGADGTIGKGVAFDDSIIGRLSRAYVKRAASREACAAAEQKLKHTLEAVEVHCQHAMHLL